MNGRMNRWMDEWIDRRMDEWIERLVETRMDIMMDRLIGGWFCSRYVGYKLHCLIYYL